MAVFIVTVDGVHCSIDEPKDPILSKNPKYYSHKFNKAAVSYEIAISVFTNQLVWMNGPFPAGKTDIQVFRHEGLKDMIPAGKKAIGDKGYRGEKGLVSTPSSHDHIDVRHFKSRARARHETFNARLKFRLP
jgi:DDE superfamily endonuclease